MSTVLATHGLNFRPAWLELPYSRWDLLAPAWTARRQLLDSRGERSAYEKDAFHQWGADFLTLQGVIHFTPEIWEAYRNHEYDALVLTAGSTYPSPSEAHAHLIALVEAMSSLNELAQTGGVLDLGLFMTTLQKAYRGAPVFRTTPLNGPVRTLAPTEVEPALGALLSEVHTQLSAGSSPIAVAAWAHHAFTQIRPFSDGNARAAFLLSQYILWRGGLPGIYLKPAQRITYYRSLQKADQSDYLPLAQLFLTGLQQAVLYALSWTGPRHTSYESALNAFSQRLREWRSHHDRERSQRIMHNRYTVFDYMEETLRGIAANLDQKLKSEEGRGARFLVAKAYPDSPYYYQFTADIVEYARKNGYYFNRSLPRGWFKLKFSLSASKKYQLVFTLHHAGYDDATLVVGAFLHFLEPLKYQQKRGGRNRPPRRRGREKTLYLFSLLPLQIPPIAFCIEKDIPSVRIALREYAESLLGEVLSEISNEIY
ncbi:MAG: Fic family protein [Bacteroidia bacterium]